MDAATLARMYEAFQEFHAYFAPAFGRKQWRERSGQYLQGLLVQSEERRNAENLSETVAASPRVLQRFLTEARWDDDAVIGRLQEYLGPRLADAQGVWVLDGSDFPKQGVKSVGVARSAYGGRDVGEDRELSGWGVSGPCGAQRPSAGGQTTVFARGVDWGCGPVCGGGGSTGPTGVPGQDRTGVGDGGACPGPGTPHRPVGGWG